MLTRRLFLAGALAAPTIVRAESLMKLWVPPAPTPLKLTIIDECVLGPAWLIDLLHPEPDRVWRPIEPTPWAEAWGTSQIASPEHVAKQQAVNALLREMLLRAGRSLGKTQMNADLARYRFK